MESGLTIPWGAIATGLTAVGGILVWLVKLAFERSLDQRDRRMEREERQKDEQAKRVELMRLQETRMIMRGLKTLTECQYEVVYQMQTGQHNGGLEDCLKNITQYRKDVDSWFEDLAVRR